MIIELAYRKQGSGAPLVILHGLFGSAANWGVIARSLAADYGVYSLDLRNHGRSPHADDMRYDVMAGDVQRFFEAHHLPPAVVLGHSMGGKVAMALSLLAPERVGSLIIVDIAPVAYAHDRLRFAKAMLAIDLDRCRTKEAVDASLRDFVPDDRARGFLLTNLQPGADGALRWRLNLPAIAAQMGQLLDFPAFDAWSRFNGPALFLGGARSEFLAPSTHGAIRHFFPSAQIHRIPEAGHNPHIDTPDQVIASVRDFLQAVPLKGCCE